MKTKLTAILLALILCLMFAGCSEETSGTPTEDNNNAASQPSSSQTESTQKAEGYGIHHAVITVEKYGVIKVELDGDTAPITVENFVTLAKSGFYDGLTFHRIIENFMIQGGDPKGDGTGGSEKEIKGEFAANGIANNIQHKRGVISMARSYYPDTASSQFFIVHQDSPHLNGQYAAFGHVTEGMDVVDAIAENTPVTDSNGTVLKENQPKIKSIVITD